MDVKEIKITSINLSSFNTRKDLNAGTEDASLTDLANSIREKGLLNPIIVRPRDDNTYDLIAGQRRFLACQHLGWATIPAIVKREIDDTDATIISLIENVHRADMNPIDKARAFHRILEKYNDHNKVAKETGVSVSTIRKYIALLSLAPSIQEKLTTSEGPAGIGTLSKLAETFATPEAQEDVLEAIGGFKQSVQLEIIKQSNGKIEKIERLREKAMEGAFETKICHGLEECNFIPDSMRQQVTDLIKSNRDNCEARLSGNPSMNREKRLEMFRASLSRLLKASEGSFVIFNARGKYVQFTGGAGDFVIDMPIVELSKDEETRLLALKEFSEGDGSRDAESNELVSYQTEYDEEELEKAVQLIERIFLEIFGLPPDYHANVELSLEDNP